MLIELSDPTTCKISRDDARILLPYMSYTGVYYKKIPIPNTNPLKFRQDRREYPKDVFFNKNRNFWYFHKGHLIRLIDEGLPIEVSTTYTEPTSSAPHIDGITLRKDQESLVRKVRRWKCGVIKSPTGSGKTIIQLALASCYSHCKVLVLAHTLDIVHQTTKKFKDYKFDNVEVRTVQSLNSRLKKDDPHTRNLLNEIDIVIIDECHHVSKFDGMYGKVLSEIKAQVRVGFTATTPEDDERLFALEGLLGPIIGELTIEKATELGILARPRIKLLRTPVNQRVKAIRRYPDVYDAGIVENEHRNNMIIELLVDNPDKTFLILVTKIKHGEILDNLSRQIMGNSVKFVRGETPGEERLEIKELLKSKSIRCVIATAVWREGVDIPSLDCVINAAGGKSEIMTLQAIGRGLRRTKDKEEVIVYDFFDPSHYYLISHFGQRITLYMDNNWL